VYDLPVVFFYLPFQGDCMLRAITFIAAATLSAGALAQAAAPAAGDAKSAAAKEAKDVNGNIAVVDGTPIKRAEVDLILRQIKQPDTAETRDKIKQKLVEFEVLTQEANRRKLMTREDVKFQVDNAKRQALIQALIADEVETHKMSDAQVKAEYDREVAASTGEQEFKARHILVSTEEEAKDIIAKLNKGDKFEDLAKASKDTGSAANGGALDWSPASGYVHEFSDAMVKLKKGETTQAPVKSQFGWHVIRLDDSRAITPPPFDQVKARLAQNMQQKQIADFVDNLVKKAKIK
jgi:peptidyl-prolyl cis-trans isomerase C